MTFNPVKVKKGMLLGMANPVTVDPTLEDKEADRADPAVALVAEKPDACNKRVYRQMHTQYTHTHTHTQACMCTRFKYPVLLSANTNALIPQGFGFPFRYCLNDTE